MFDEVTQPTAHGRFHFAGEVASHHHAWVAGALDSAIRVVDEILRVDKKDLLDLLHDKYGWSSVFSDKEDAEEQCFKGLFSLELEEAEIHKKEMNTFVD